MNFVNLQSLLLILVLPPGVCPLENQAPSNLLQQATQLAGEPHHIDEALDLVNQANTILEKEAPLSVEHAKVLDYYAFLLMVCLGEKAIGEKKSSGYAQTQWRVEAHPITEQALSICERICSAESDELAEALETEAQAMDAPNEARKLRKRSTEIRKKMLEVSPRPQREQSGCYTSASRDSLSHDLAAGSAVA